MTENTVDKTKALVEAARRRREIEQANSRQEPKTEEERFTPEELDVLKDDAEIMAEGKPQAVAGTLTGEIDIEAMGDVKGDGGDAKDYDDDDPDKALGVPTYIHGLHETRDGVDTVTAAERENSISARTRAEQERGRGLIKERGDERDRRVAKDERIAIRETAPVVTGGTTVEDATAEKIAADKAKAEEKAKAETAAAKKADAKAKK